MYFCYSLGYSSWTTVPCQRNLNAKGNCHYELPSSRFSVCVCWFTHNKSRYELIIKVDMRSALYGTAVTGSRKSGGFGLVEVEWRPAFWEINWCIEGWTGTELEKAPTACSKVNKEKWIYQVTGSCWKRIETPKSWKAMKHFRKEWGNTGEKCTRLFICIKSIGLWYLLWLLLVL